VIRTVLLTLLLTFNIVQAEDSILPGEFSTELSVEASYFPSTGQFNNTKQSEISFFLKPDYSYSWDDDRKVLAISPYLVYSNVDSKKTHIDIREASFTAAHNLFEYKVGISKVYWGVTESQHLVDVINQTDAVVNIDGEHRLGQPMINGTFISDYGNLDLFILPYFRTRTYSGKKGRFHGSYIIDNDLATYQHEDEDKHIDLAARYSHSIGNLDVGVSYFTGTDREPIISLSTSGSSLSPHYIQANQYLLDFQYIHQAWIFKLEGLHKTGLLIENYNAGILGYEYTFSNIKNSGLDLGVLTEYLYDQRDLSQTLLNNHLFMAGRLAFNDQKSTALLAGVIYNLNASTFTSLRAEGSRRINESLNWAIESNVVLETQQKELLNTFKDDDYVKLSLRFYF
jgi:hypothetical protein